jgi:hypothetical protein
VAELMDVDADVVVAADIARVFAVVADLGTYPAWTDLVHTAEPLSPDVWDIELRARLGRFARSKRLRMRRTQADAAGAVVRFERDETDGHRHSPWVLSATLSEVDDGVRVAMHLHYGGALWTGGLLERALADQIVTSRQRLADLLAATH